jgi:pimeloyl-ACP methyl ester carboxylesterase
MTEASRPEADLVRTFDGSLIAVRRFGTDGGVPLLVVNAIGATLAAWARSLVDIERQRPVIAWDHRGLHASEPPQSPRIDPGAHAEDAVAALDHHGFERAALVSWSNGARIAIEIATRYPERVAALAMVSGGYGHAVNRLLRGELASALPVIASVAKYFSGPLATGFRALVARPELVGFIRQSGMVGATADTAAVAELLTAMAACDLKLLLAQFQEVAGDSAADLLGQIEAPTVLIVGDHDQFTPAAMTEQMTRTIPECRTITYEGATHYLPLEYPARLSDDLRGHLAETGL